MSTIGGLVRVRVWDDEAIAVLWPAAQNLPSSAVWDAMAVRTRTLIRLRSPLLMPLNKGVTRSWAGMAVGVLGGMNCLGGAEFRLPLLIMLFGFGARPGRDPQQALSLVAVLTACRPGWP